MTVKMNDCVTPGFRNGGEARGGEDSASIWGPICIVGI